MIMLLIIYGDYGDEEADVDDDDRNLKRMAQSVPHKVLGQTIGGVFCHLCLFYSTLICIACC